MIPSVPFHSARARQLCQGLFLLVLTVLCGAAQAATINFNGGAVSNCSYSNQVYTCSSLPLQNWNDLTVIASGYTVKVTSSQSFGYNQGLQMSGSASLQTTSGSLNIGDIAPSLLDINGGTLVAAGDFKIGAQAQTIRADISAASMTIGTGSNTKITGSLTATGDITLASNVTIVGPIKGSTIGTNSPVDLRGDIVADVAFTLASGSNLNGNITAPTVTINPSSVTVMGDIAASSGLTIGSGNTVHGNVSGGYLTMAPSNSEIKGDVSMSGAIDIGSGNLIQGDVTAKTIVMRSSDAQIKGDASAESVTLGWHDVITKTITCTGAGASGCSCVTNNSGYTGNDKNAPSCGAAQPSAPHHIQISHPGTALTCQPQTVTLTACANSACTAPNYTGSVTVALSPGGGDVTISGGVNSAATVSQGSAGTATLGATGTGISNATVCINTANSGASNQCAMTFADTGLSLSVANHRAGANATLTVAALQRSGNNPSCVPLFANVNNASVNFTCGYNNPVSSRAAAVPVKLGSTFLASSASSQCSAGGQAVSLNFNGSGVASATLVYPEVGDVSLSASYTNGGLKAVGSTNFIAAPSSFYLSATSLDGSKINAGNAVNETSSAFIGAGVPFKVRVEARNSSGTLTSNFGQESSAQAVNYSSSLVAPAGIAFTAPSGLFPAFSNGVAEANPMTWSEIGIFNLAAQLTSGSYLGTGFSVTGNSNIGRFIPDHFDVSIVSANGVPMTCTANCPASGLAVYSHQPFNVAVSAFDAAGRILGNYQGAYAKPVTFSGWASAGSTVPTDQNPPATPSGNSMTGSIAAASFANGAASAPIQYQFANIDPSAAATARAAPTNVYVRAVDSDGASSARVSGSVEPGLRVLSGRLIVAHAFGSELSPMPLQARAQYWTGSGYVNNLADNNQTGYPLNSAGLLLANCKKNLVSGSACLSTVALEQTTTLRFTSGAAPFRLRAPGLAGSVDVSIKDTVIPFLPSVTGIGTVQFGVYRADPVLYLREVY